MPQQWLMYPVFVMLVLTLYISLRMIKLRFRAVREGNLSASYFKLNRGGELPEYLAKTERHYANLFELPVLFYAVILFILTLKQGDLVYLVMAWLFVALRIVHAGVHIGHNNLAKRRKVFIAGAIVLHAMWLRLFIESLWITA